ncbi:MAG TPA: hypothetical protein DD979_02540 [Gammaproteobacteria bacterium]|nr:hypothetical protein [Gammaproteobacteria bacterium]
MARSSDSFFLLALLKDKTFQAREVKRLIYISALYLVITTALLGVFYHQLLGQLVAGQAPMLFVAEDVALINEQIPAMGGVLGRWIGVMLVVNVLVTTIIGVYILRKLGQPILALKRALRDIGDGKLDTRLRETDNKEFAEITDAFNRAQQQIHHQIAEAKRSLKDLQDQPEPDAQQLAAALQNCANSLDYFTTVNSDVSDDRGQPDVGTPS